jgi:hypothetical protein
LNLNEAVNLDQIEAPYLASGTDLATTSSSVLGLFNAQFAITASAGQATLLVVNDTTGNKAAVWQYVESGTLNNEIQTSELTLTAQINGTDATFLQTSLGLY